MITKGKYLSGLNAEVTLIEWRGDKYLLDCHSYGVKVYDWNGNFIRQIGATTMSSFGSAFVDGNDIYLVTSHANSIALFKTTDLTNEQSIGTIVTGTYFNTSVTKADDTYFIAYEGSGANGYNFNFAKSSDLITWTAIGQQFSQGYAACPFLKYIDGWFYVIYLAGFGKKTISCIARSRDLFSWRDSDRNFLEPLPSEKSNNSDVDVMEVDGMCYISYFTGDKATWGKIGIGTFDGTMKDLFESFF